MFWTGLLLIGLIVPGSLTQTCLTHSDSFGFCVPELVCSRQTRQTLRACNTTGLYCCSVDNEYDWSAISERHDQSQNPKFPTDCGSTVVGAPREVSNSRIEPDEFSWLASLEYGNGTIGICAGSVINSRYVLTAASCVTGTKIRRLGGLAAVRLGNLEGRNRRTCDYGTAQCQHYQRFGIEEATVHSSFREQSLRIINDIALLRLDRKIRFGSKLKPICLPIGNDIPPAPAAESLLSISGWGRTSMQHTYPPKRKAIVVLWNAEQCNESISLDETQLCTGDPSKHTCSGDLGGPLMQFLPHSRMLLEGIVSYGFVDCLNTDLPSVYTRVRSYRAWIENNMRLP